MEVALRERRQIPARSGRFFYEVFRPWLWPAGNPRPCGLGSEGVCGRGAGLDPAGRGGLHLRPAGEQSLVTRIPAWVVTRPWPVTLAVQTNFFQQPLMVITVIEAAIYL